MLPEAKYIITRTKNIKECLYNLEDEYSVSIVGQSLNFIFNEIRERELEEGNETSEIEELEF